MIEVEPPGLDRQQGLAWYLAQRLKQAQQAPCFAASCKVWSDANPYKPCPDPQCRHGQYETRNAARELIAIMNCATCRGLARVPMTAEEIRDEYRRVRASACERSMMTHKLFDAHVARSVTETAKPGDLSPGLWLAAARRIAEGRMR